MAFPRWRGSGREGFATLAVLWVLTGVSALALLLLLTARDATGAARNRMSLARAAWAAEGCAERARAAIAEAMTEPAHDDDAWTVLDEVVAASPLVAGCQLALRPAGMTVNVNDADAGQIRQVLVAAGLDPDTADSLADAILDWRDADDEPQAGGAERAWYSAMARDEPRNGPFVSSRELTLVRGMEALPAADTLFGVETERMLLGRVPTAVMHGLPGFSREIVARVEELRTTGRGLLTLDAVGASLSPEARQSFLASYAELATRVTTTPDAWTLTSVARDGEPVIAATLELRLVRAGRRAAVVRRRSWP